MTVLGDLQNKANLMNVKVSQLFHAFERPMLSLTVLLSFLFCFLIIPLYPFSLSRCHHQLISCVYCFSECECNGHADKCYFDPAVWAASGQTSGGVCIDCQHNTIGTKCEKCKPLHYKDPNLLISDPNVCKRKLK